MAGFNMPSLGSGSKEYEFKDLQEKYDRFAHPAVVIKINDVEINEKDAIPVFDLSVDLTSGFEASTCEFSFGDIYDQSEAKYLYDKVKKYIMLGSKVEVCTGYSGSASRIFIGVITAVNFIFEEGDIPAIRVTAMDAKGVMMSSSFSKQVKEKSYLDAVEALLQEIKDKKFSKSEIIENFDFPPKSADATPGDEPLDKTVEMVAESDYEFIVRAAKRSNFEFYIENGVVKYRPAKSDKTVRMKLNPGWGITSFDIRYDITGMVESIEARGMDVAKGEMISAEVKYSTGNLSQGNYAAAMLKGSKRVYIDASIRSKDDAESRAKSLYEAMSYRYGSFECQLFGLPEFLPGYFYDFSGVSTGADNTFYVNRVIHTIDRDSRYLVKLFGVAAEKKSNGLGF